METILLLDTEKWKVISVYKRGVATKLSEILEEVGQQKDTEENLLFRGDFNVKTRAQWEVLWNDEEEDRPRNSKDKHVNSQGEQLIRLIEKMGQSILGGNIEGNIDRDHTSAVIMDTSAIDYGIPNEATWEKITCRRVACRIESFSFRNNCEDVHREEKGGRTFVAKRNQEMQGKIRNIKIRGK